MKKHGSERILSPAQVQQQADLTKHVGVQVQKQTRDAIIATALSGLAIGAGGRGLLGLYNQARRGMKGPSTQTSVSNPTLVDIPILQPEERDKLATIVLPKPPQPPKPPKPPKAPVAPVAPKAPLAPVVKLSEKGPLEWMGVMGTGINPTQMRHIPIAGPGIVAAGAGGVYGGYKVMDYLLDQRRRAEVQNELDEAKKQYEKSLLSQHKVKAAEADLGDSLDHLFDLMEKAASPAPPPTVGGGLTSELGTLANGYGLWALGTGVPAAGIAFGLTRARQKRNLLRKAQKRLDRARSLVRPAPMLLHPVPLSSRNSDTQMGDVAEEDELIAAGLV